MKINSSKTAYTLVELIVSLALVSVIVLGIFSINMVLNNNNQDYGQRYLVRSETQATLNHILNDASLAVGSGTYVGSPAVLDQGIVTGLVYGNNTAFCIHQQPSTGDTWVCYTFDTTSGDAAYHQIYYCNVTYNLYDGTGNRGASSNNGGSTASICGSNTEQFLGTAYSVSPSYNSTNGFSITIQNCFNNSASSCSSTGTSTDPANNPEVQVSGSVFPPQQGNG